jgi:hypothetical protein
MNAISKDMEITKEDWEFLREAAAVDAEQDRLMEEAQAFDEMIMDYSKRGGPLICKLAKIPEHHRKDFIREAEELIYKTWSRSSTRDLKNWISCEELRAIEDLEAGVRKAYGAIQALPKERLCTLQSLLLDATPYWPAGTNLAWNDALLAMVAACARISGRNPQFGPKRGRGRPPKSSTKESYPLQNFIKWLARIVRRNEGVLTLYRQEERGTWVDVLAQLTPLLPAGFIPNKLSLSMIETIQAQVNSERRFPF